MPTYELSLILRHMTRPELLSTLKRTGTAIFDRGGIIRKLENFGTHELPHKISAHGLVHRTGTHFHIEFDTPPQAIADLREEFGRDVDIIRRQVFRVKPISEQESTPQEEQLPPAYRKDVQKMIEIGKRKQKPKYNYNSGLDYYPFQK
uniref:Small ribosomal subunit protein bS6m n=1 Tax=Tabanus bromius TaxID=304241 RepID=A0A0K8TN53_TABBR